MNPLFEAFFTHINHCYSRLPYNLNWKVDTKPVQGFLSKNPLSVIDIGARGGAMGELAGLTKFLHYVGFDADQEECRRLMSATPGDYAAYRVYPYFIGNGGSVDFHLYSQRGWSSSFEIDPEYSRAFSEPGPRLEETLRFDSVRLDDVAVKHELSAPDLLKVDTQGSELEILRGAGHLLEQTALVEVEVEFYPIYSGQPLFADVDTFLRSSGFEILYLNRVFVQRKVFYKGLSRGQMIFGDALYGRSPTHLGDMSPERIAKYIILLCQYGHLDLARQILDEHPNVRELCPGLAQCFPSPPSMLRRGLASQLDKLTCLLLHLRRTNHRYGDSDRSWPVR